MDKHMKHIQSILAALLSAMALVSCNDWLTLGPIDYYGSESYWKTEANFDSYIDGMHKNMRDQAWTTRSSPASCAAAPISTEPAPTAPPWTMPTSSCRTSTRTTPV